MLKNNKINIYGCLLKLIYTPVFATKTDAFCASVFLLPAQFCFVNERMF